MFTNKGCQVLSSAVKGNLVNEITSTSINCQQYFRKLCYLECLVREAVVLQVKTCMKTCMKIEWQDKNGDIGREAAIHSEGISGKFPNGRFLNPDRISLIALSLGSYLSSPMSFCMFLCSEKRFSFFVIRQNDFSSKPLRYKYWVKK